MGIKHEFLWYIIPEISLWVRCVMFDLEFQGQRSWSQLWRIFFFKFRDIYSVDTDTKNKLRFYHFYIKRYWIMSRGQKWPLPVLLSSSQNAVLLVLKRASRTLQYIACSQSQQHSQSFRNCSTAESWIFKIVHVHSVCPHFVWGFGGSGLVNKILWLRLFNTCHRVSLRSSMYIVIQGVDEEYYWYDDRSKQERNGRAYVMDDVRQTDGHNNDSTNEEAIYENAQ